MDDLDELERRCKEGKTLLTIDKFLSLISRCRDAEKERYEARADLGKANEVMVREHQRYLSMKAERDAFKLELDCLNAAMKEGEEAAVDQLEKELKREAAHDGT